MPLGGTLPYEAVDHRASTHVSTQLWSNYDKALQSFLGKFRWDNRPLYVIYASPDRAFSQLSKILKDENVQVVPLTFSSLERVGSAAFDRSRFVEASQHFWVTRDAPRKIVGSRKPRPVNISYQWDVWGRNKFDVDWIHEQLSSQVRDCEFYLTVDHPFPVDKRLVRFRLDDEPKEGPVYSDPYKERSIRRTFGFVAEGWLCYPYELVGVVDRVHTEFWESPDLVTPNEKFGEVVVPPK